MDKFILNEKNYKKKNKLDKDNIEKNENLYNSNKIKLKLNLKEELVFVNKEIKRKIFHNDIYNIKEKGDILLNNWIKTQKDPLIIFISEIIPETKISNEMERFRPLIKTTQTISIEEYRKKKKIGEKGVIYLKRLKEKYGNIILKVLWANINI